MLDADVLVLHFGGFGEGRIQHGPGASGQIGFRRTAHLGNAVNGQRHFLRNGRRGGAQFTEHRFCNAFGLRQHGAQKMLRFDLLIAVSDGKLLCALNEFLGLDGKFVKSHAFLLMVEKIFFNGTPEGPGLDVSVGADDIQKVCQDFLSTITIGDLVSTSQSANYFRFLAAFFKRLLKAGWEMPSILAAID